MSEELAPVVRVKQVAFWLLVVFAVAAAFTRKPENALASAAGIVIAVSAAAASLRRVQPPAVVVVLSLVAGAGVVLDTGPLGSNLGYFGLCVLAFLCVLSVGPRIAAVFISAAATWLTIRLIGTGDTGWMPWIGGVLVSALGAGVIVHEQGLLAQLQSAQQDLAERTRLQERARIARDLHDVIAHSLTVSLLHISAARMAVQHDPGDADRALAEAERLGRESLDEVRAIVGLTRADKDGGGSSLVPTPGIESIQALVERYRSAGARIHVELDSGAASVPATIGTTAYRIAQEALTNAARHAPGSRVELRLAAPDGSLELEVFSAGPSAAVWGDNGGNGLHSMRERAEAVGGAFDAGPVTTGDGGGWRVRASLPLGPSGPPRR